MLVVSLPFLAVGLGALAVSLSIFYAAGKQVVGTAHASVTDPVEPGDAPRGTHATVTGEILVGPEGPLVAPIAGEEAVAHRLRIDQQTDGVGWWTVVDSGHSTSFYLQGPTGRILVEPDDEQPRAPIDDEIEVGATETLPAAIRERFETSSRFDLDTTPQLLGEAVDEPRRYGESVVSTGETVYVYGYVTDDTEPRIDASESNEFRFSYDSPSGMTAADADSLRSVAGQVAMGVFLVVFGGMFTVGGGLTLFGAIEMIL